MSRSLANVARRGSVVLAGLGWLGATLALHQTGLANLAQTVTLVAVGALVVAGFQAYRWHRMVIHRIEAQGRRIEQLSAATSDLEHSMHSIPAQTVARKDLEEVVGGAGRDIVRSTRKSIAKDLQLTYRQLEALQNLHAIGKVDRPMPPARDWACSPDLLMVLVNLVDSRRPGLIVECGSGLSTLWFGLTLKRLGIAGRVVALEHVESFAEKNEELLTRHGVVDLVEIRCAPLETVEIGGQTFQWYAEKTWADLAEIELLLVDGPPAETGQLARFPALPQLATRLHPEGIVVLDDMVRTDEQTTLERWLEEFTEYTAERIRLEKNAALLQRQS